MQRPVSSGSVRCVACQGGQQARGAWRAPPPVWRRQWLLPSARVPLWLGAAWHAPAWRVSSRQQGSTSSVPNAAECGAACPGRTVQCLCGPASCAPRQHVTLRRVPSAIFHRAHTTSRRRRPPPPGSGDPGSTQPHAVSRLTGLRPRPMHAPAPLPGAREHSPGPDPGHLCALRHHAGRKHHAAPQARPDGCVARPPGRRVT